MEELAKLNLTQGRRHMAKRSTVLQVVEPITDHPTATRHQPLKIKLDHLKTFEPLTVNQKKFFDAYKRGDYFIALHGVAGTGKSFIAVYKALEEVLDKGNPFSKVIIVRSAVQGREIGHLPGDIEGKLEIYQQPYVQICDTLFGRKDAYQRLEEQHVIEFISTSFIRGMTFDDAIIIVDEMQNMTYEEIDTVMTRVGHRSKIIWCGDYRQCDLKKNDKSGLLKFFDIVHLMKAFTRVEFTTNDIVRSSLVKDYILAKIEYEDNGQKNVRT
jgi:phosphate starvation-inducible protein PhoH